MKIFTTDQLKNIDLKTIENEGITSLQLIERVAESATCEIISRWRSNKKVAIFAGPGNNGADALSIGRMLVEQGYTPEIFLFNIGGNRLSPDCAACKERLLMAGEIDFTEVTGLFSLPHLSSEYLVIDGLFGTGLHDPLSGCYRTLVRYINESGATIVSIDVPSGLFGDWNPQSINRDIIHANLTLAVQFPRLSFFIADNAELVGEWKLLDIELSQSEIRHTPAPFYYVEKSDVRRVLQPRNEFSSKADYGSALLVAGSSGMLGAAVLAARGALRGGVGKVTVHSARSGHSILQSSVPEALFQADTNDICITDMLPRHDYSAIAIGPGIGTNEATINALEAFLKSYDKPVILDADALNCIARRNNLLHYVPVLSIITPHAGEFDRLFGPQPSHEARLAKAIEMAHNYNILIILKGRYTAIVRPDGKIYFNSSGNPAMATPGSGDVLTGLLVAMLAQGYKPEIAALLAVYIHGYAGDMAAEVEGQYGVTAGDIASRIGQAIKAIVQ
jgi:NAD(P)H-hydrate epimerase